MTQNRDRNVAGRQNGTRRERPENNRSRKRTSDRSSPVKFIFVLMLIVLVIWGIATMISSGKVKTIRVTGSSSATEEEIINWSGITIGSSTDNIDENNVRYLIQSHAPLVLKSISVRGSVVTLEVGERKGVMQVRRNSEFLILDAELYVVSTSTREPEGMIQIVGLDIESASSGEQVSAGETRLNECIELYAVLKAEGATDRITQIDVTEIRNLTMTSDTDTLICLGDAENMTQKVRWAVATLDELAKSGTTGGTIDVTSGKKADFMPDGI